MKNEQPNPLALADALEKHLGGNTAHQAAALLRTQHAELSHLKDAMGHLGAALARKDALLRQALEAMKDYFDHDTFGLSVKAMQAITKELQ